MDLARLIDLSHAIEPETGQRPLHAEMVAPPDAGDLPKDQWYIMHNVAFLDHIATHIEVPYHTVEHGADLAAVPLDRLCGEAVILDLRGARPGAVLPLLAVQEAAARAGGIRTGDIVFCRFDYDRDFGKADGREPPYFASEAIEWLVGQGMKLMGVDTGTIELAPDDPRTARQHNHHLLMDNGIPLIENLANLGSLAGPRATVFAFPVAVRRLDSFPLRVVALEES